MRGLPLPRYGLSMYKTWGPHLAALYGRTAALQVTYTLNADTDEDSRQYALALPLFALPRMGLVQAGG